MTRERLVYKTVLSLVTIATSGLIRLIFSLLVGHVFGSVTLGHVNVILSTAVFATLFCSPGLGQAASRQMATRGLQPGSGPGRVLLSRVTVAHHLICGVIAILVGLLVTADGRVEPLVAGLLTFGYGAYTFYKAVLYGVDWVRRYAVLELTWDALFLVVMVAVVFSHLRIWALAPLAMVYLGFSLGAHLTLFRRRRPAHTWTGTAEATLPVVGQRIPAADDRGVYRVADVVSSGRERFGWWHAIGAYALVTTLGTVSSAGFLQLSQLFAARIGDSYGTGLFAAAMSLVVPAYLLPRAVSVVLFPAMARAVGRSDRELVRSHLAVGTTVLTSGLLPGFVLVAILATPLISVIYGSAYGGGGATLTIMVWATWISIASVPAVNALASDKGYAYFVPAGASLAGFLVGLAWWFTVATSITAVAWGYLIGSLVQSAVPMIEAARRHREPGIGRISRTLLAAGSGLIVSLVVLDAAWSTQLIAGIVMMIVATLLVLPEIRSLWRMEGLRAARDTTIALHDR